MRSFIDDVLTEINKKQDTFTDVTFILPSKRAGLFLKHSIAGRIEQPQFVPSIISIEEFVEQISNLTTTNTNELLFKFYSCYCEVTPKEKQETFDVFSSWAQIALQDFNEIDRYLIPPKDLFSYIKDINDINHWSLVKTDAIESYLKFWNHLFEYYTKFREALLKNNEGYQGLIYREAVLKVDEYIKANGDKKHVFLGFNALNTAEKEIIQKLLKNPLNQIFWDTDAYFFNNKNHDASYFLRQHKKTWSYYENNSFNSIITSYQEPKSINIFGIPKMVGQAKQIGSILDQLTQEGVNLNTTAVVLGDESLLIPVVNALPEQLDSVNITMGYPLKHAPLANLFQLLFKIKKAGQSKFYSQDILQIISSEYIESLLTIDDINYSLIIKEEVLKLNLSYLSLEDFGSLCETELPILKLLFTTNFNVNKTLTSYFGLIDAIKANCESPQSSFNLTLEYLYKFNSLFQTILGLNKKYNHIKSISSLEKIYNEFLSKETLDFKGNPLQGLQIMGMLETRVIDYETVIISSVNEGILPGGKSNNSFIPFDVKLQYKLPTYKEKDAIYAYHFYRLLQRAKRVFVLYNTEVDALLGGEKSRFITQLQLENIHNVTHQIVAPTIAPTLAVSNEINKSSSLIKSLQGLALKGFSPSSLTNYVLNPLGFYKQNVLGINTPNEIEETVAANTLGTIIHNSLEDLYKPYLNVILTTEILKNLVLKVELYVSKWFKAIYKTENFKTGKNLIAYEIAKRFITNFINQELHEVKAGNSIKIIALEERNKVELNIPELPFPIYLKGTVDRVDEYNNCIRVIDYKTGKVIASQLQVKDWEDITTDYKKYSKSFQVLSYAFMLYKSKQVNLPIEAGVISFKNLKSGFLKFTKKGASAKENETLITEAMLKDYFSELKTLILEIFNPEIPFTEKPTDF